MLKFTTWSKTFAGSIVLLSFGGIAAMVVANPYPSPIQSLEAQGVEIVDRLDNPGKLQGYIGRYQGRAMEIYLTADEQHAIIGTMIDGSGESVAAEQLRAATASNVDWDGLGKTRWIAEGDPDGEQIVYAFMDPNCPYCSAFWKASREHITTRGVQLRFIMVGMLRPSSEALAANILGAVDPVAALAAHEVAREQGKVAEPGKASSRVVSQVRDNTQFMRSQEIFATPTVVFKDRNGSVQMLQGLPNDELMASEIFRPRS